MKKQLALALGLVSMTGSVYASKARLEALGQDANGSQFIGDNRNVFLNAAHVNLHKDLATFEWGSASGAGTFTDTAAAPRAEGGVFMATDSLVYGVYLGNENNASNGFRAAAGLTAAEALESNNLDLYVGGDAGVQWGAGLQYTNTAKEDGAVEQQAMRLNLGAISGDVEGFANLGLVNKSDNGTTEFKGGFSVDAGVTYNLEDLALMARIKNVSATATTAAVDADLKVSDLSVGAARSYKLNEKANLWLSGFYATTSRELYTGTAAKTSSLPVAIALEVSAREWLVLRASVKQNVLISQNDTGAAKNTVTDTTDVAAGASLVFGDLSVDGVIGDVSNTGVAGTETGTLRTDSLMSRVSMTYRF